MPLEIEPDKPRALAGIRPPVSVAALLAGTLMLLALVTLVRWIV